MATGRVPFPYISDLDPRTQYELERNFAHLQDQGGASTSPVLMIAQAGTNGSTANELALANYTVGSGADAGAVFNAAFAAHPGGTFIIGSGTFVFTTFLDCSQGGLGRLHLIGSGSVSGEFTIPVRATRLKFNSGSQFSADHVSASVKVGDHLTVENLSFESFFSARSCFAPDVNFGVVNLNNVFLDNWQSVFTTTGSAAKDCASYGRYSNVTFSPQNESTALWSYSDVTYALLVNVSGSDEGGSNFGWPVSTNFTNSCLTNVPGLNFTDVSGNSIVDTSNIFVTGDSVGGDLTGTLPNPTVAGVSTASRDIKITAVGKGFYLKEGANATMGVATLVAGTVVVSTTKVTASSRIHLTVQSLGTVAVPKAVAVTARTAGTSFTITSADATDTSVVAWVILEPS